MGPSERRDSAILEAQRRWDGAPAHIKIMAGAYVGPLLEAIDAIGFELALIQGQIAHLKGEKSNG